VRSPFPFLVLLSVLALPGCSRREPMPSVVTGGDAKVGARLIEQYHCGSCHAIPEIPEQFGRRSYIAGSIPNFPDALTRWIVDPAAMKPGTTMPAMGVSEPEARHMAAYLATLR
jgi:cytochrome c